MSLASLLNQTIIAFPDVSFDRYGSEVDSTAGVTYKARVQQVTKTRMTTNNEIVGIDLVCMLMGDPEVDQDDRIDYGGVKYRVFGKKTAIDSLGNIHHVTLECAKWSK